MRNEDRYEQAEDSDAEVYNEAEDEDFSPEQQDAEIEGSSSDEDEQKTQSKKRKTVEIEELDSGDEATIRERNTKKRKKDGQVGSDEEGGLIKTRAQRLAEKVEKKQHKKSSAGKVTINVDEVWADLAKLPIGRPVSVVPDNSLNDENAGKEAAQHARMVKIKRRIKFAGQVTEVEEEVAHDSAEAQAYIAEQSKEQEDVKEVEEENKLNRPLRRFSRFEPNPLGVVKGVASDKLRRRAPTRNDMLMAEYRVEENRRRKAEKLTTMQKTSLDWKGFVQEQGLGDELQEYGKSKKGFLAREQFLDRVHGANEVARRDARLKT